jgi:hypothetical protein
MVDNILKYLIETTHFLWYPMGNAFEQCKNDKQGS